MEIIDTIPIKQVINSMYHYFCTTDCELEGKLFELKWFSFACRHIFEDATGEQSCNCVPKTLPVGMLHLLVKGSHFILQQTRTEQQSWTLRNYLLYLSNRCLNDEISRAVLVSSFLKPCFWLVRMESQLKATFVLESHFSLVCFVRWRKTNNGSFRGNTETQNRLRVYQTKDVIVVNVLISVKLCGFI